MGSLLKKWQSFAPHVQSILRMVAALMFVQFGTMKLFSFPVGVPGGHLTLISEAGIAGILEAVGGAFLLLGLFTRPVAFILSGEMAVAYFQVHFPHGYWTISNGGLPAVFFCFTWLYFSTAGAGPWSIDAWWSRRRHRTRNDDKADD